MHCEYWSLGVLGLFSLFAWFPAALGKYQAFGKGHWAVSNREPPEGVKVAPWAGRVDRAYRNLLDFFIPFATAVIVLGVFQAFNETTQWLCTVFLFTRLAHFAAYWVGWCRIRTLVWAIGLVCNLWLYGILFPAIKAAN